MKKLYSLLITSILLSFNISKGAEIVLTKDEARYFITGDFRQIVREFPDRAIRIWHKADIPRELFEDSLRYLSKKDLDSIGYSLSKGVVKDPRLGTDATKEVQSGMISFKWDNIYATGERVVVKRKIRKEGDPEYTWAVVLIKTTYNPKHPNAYLVQLDEQGTTKPVEPNEKDQAIGRLRLR